MSVRPVVDCGTDPVAEGWTVALWAATARLHLCLHVHRDEGEFDSAGRWRRRQHRHFIVGRPANQAHARAMAQHFCSLVRQSARAFERSRVASAHARRSFQLAFAARLTARLRAALAEARNADEEVHASEAAANAAALNEAGIASLPIPDSDGIANWDRAAVRHGRAAADNVSLVLRDRAAPAAPPRPSRNQMALPF
jgi:hypothetical protein